MSDQRNPTETFTSESLVNETIKRDYQRASGQDHIERQHHDPDDQLKTVDVLGIVFFVLLSILLLWRFT